MPTLLRLTVASLALVSSSALAQLWTAAVGLAFFSAGGLEAIIGVLLAGFTVMPPGQALFPDVNGLVHSAALIFGQALVIAMPVFAGAIVMQVALALVARAEPQLNVYSLAFGVLTLLGLALFADTLKESVAIGRDLAREAPRILGALVG